jgi:hypothetical protein
MKLQKILLLLMGLFIIIFILHFSHQKIEKFNQPTIPIVKSLQENTTLLEDIPNYLEKNIKNQKNKFITIDDNIRQDEQLDLLNIEIDKLTDLIKSLSSPIIEDNIVKPQLQPNLSIEHNNNHFY